jgi:hypothetical protein
MPKNKNIEGKVNPFWAFIILKKKKKRPDQTHLFEEPKKKIKPTAGKTCQPDQG